MAGKNSRSSKTAHVLNLLSGGTPEVKPDAVFSSLGEMGEILREL